MAFARAKALDPSWDEAELMEQSLLKYLVNVQEMIDTKACNPLHFYLV